MKAIEWAASDTRYARCNKCQDRPGKDGLGRPCKTCKGTGWLHGPGLSARWCPLCGTQHAVTKGEPSPWPNVSRMQIEILAGLVDPAAQITVLREALRDCVTPVPDFDIRKHRDRLVKINDIARAALGESIAAQ